MKRGSWCRWSLVLPIIAIGFLPSTTMAEGPPPRNLHLENSHWTAWTPPPVADGAQVYTVRQGDSLWSIAQQLLSDPHLWPQIWEQNQYILDAHWIYPGDPLVISGLSAQLGGSEGVAGPPLDGTGEMVSGISDDPFAEPYEDVQDNDGSLDSVLGNAVGSGDAPVPLGYEADIYCTGYIGSLDEEFAYSIAGSEYDFLTPNLNAKRSTETIGEFGKATVEKYGLGLGDIVYVDGGSADGLGAGELLSAVSPRDKVFHPTTSDLLGRLYAYRGRVRILSVQEETAIGEIVQLCSPIPVGTSLKIFEPEPIPLRRITPIRPVNYPARPEELDGAPIIISAMDNLITGAGLVALGTGYLVVIDNGYAQDVAPGDIYTIYRRGRKGYPPTVIGELGILSVFENASLARILRSRYAIYLGDPLLIK